MLSRRLISSVGAALLLTACAGVDGTERGAIRENVVEPGITAIGQARSESCSINASTLRTAIDAYSLIEGSPPPNEQALVDAGFLRNAIDDWDIVDGVLVAENPACGDVPTTVPTEEIVTESSSGAMTVDDVLATFTAADIDELGGPDCARQLAIVGLGASQFAEREGVEAESLAEIEAAGLLAEPVTLWQVVDEMLRPADGSPCLDFADDQSADETDEQAEACSREARILDTAREAYLAVFDSEPTVQDLIDEGYVREPGPEDVPALELVGGVVRALPDGPCTAEALGATGPTASDASDCESQRRTLEIGVEAYSLKFGELPRSEKDLVTSGLLRDVSPGFDLDEDATVVPAPGGGCQ